eukprot:m.213246 g.213246  ORF g.213246 m.213246 type:complete len:89 (+) comp18602_c0_seq5:1128-1394(+)
MHSLWASIKSWQASSPFSTMHWSLGLRVSGQAQHGLRPSGGDADCLSGASRAAAPVAADCADDMASVLLQLIALTAETVVERVEEQQL